MHAERFSIRLLQTLCAALVALLLAAPLTAGAGSKASPIGTWQTIDDETGKRKAVVKVYEYRGKVYGKIIRLNQKKVDTPLCHKCSGAKKDKPIEGMVIMWGLEQDEANSWDEGTILDPGKGKTYDCAIELSANGKTLKVRGYKGWSALGRTQTWHRM